MKTIPELVAEANEAIIAAHRIGASPAEVATGKRAMEAMEDLANAGVVKRIGERLWTAVPVGGRTPGVHTAGNPGWQPGDG